MNKMMSRIEAQISFLRRESRWDIERDALHYVLGRLTNRNYSIESWEERSLFLNYLDVLKQEIAELSALKKQGLFNSIFGVGNIWEDAANQAVMVCYEVIRSEDVRAARYHPDGYFYRNYLLEARNEAVSSNSN